MRMCSWRGALRDWGMSVRAEARTAGTRRDIAVGENGWTVHHKYSHPAFRGSSHDLNRQGCMSSRSRARTRSSSPFLFGHPHAPPTQALPPLTSATHRRTRARTNNVLPEWFSPALPQPAPAGTMSETTAPPPSPASPYADARILQRPDGSSGTPLTARTSSAHAPDVTPAALGLTDISAIQ